MMTDLKRDRFNSGLKQVEVAKLARIDRVRLSMIENGWIEAKPEELAKIKTVISRYAKE